MKKMYEKPQAEIVRVRCMGRLLDDDEWTGQDVWGGSNNLNYTDAKEMRIRYEEEKEMHEVLGGIFSEENLVNPWE